MGITTSNLTIIAIMDMASTKCLAVTAIITIAVITFGFILPYLSDIENFIIVIILAIY